MVNHRAFRAATTVFSGLASLAVAMATGADDGDEPLFAVVTVGVVCYNALFLTVALG